MSNEENLSVPMDKRETDNNVDIHFKLGRYISHSVTLLSLPTP